MSRIFSLSTPSEKLTNKERKHRNVVHVLMVIHLFLVVFLVYTLPSNLLNYSEFFRYMVDVSSMFMPQIILFDRFSRFPDISKIMWSFELLMSPIWGLIVYGLYPFKPRIKDRKMFIYSALFCISMLIIGYLFVPGMPSGNGPSGRISLSIMNSKMSFSLWSSLVSIGMGMCMAGVVKSMQFILSCKD
jgi:hypothetical protein